MAKSTKLILADGIYITDIGHRRTGSAEIATDIGPRRLVDDIGHHHSTLELSEPQLVRRVSAYRDSAGNIHLELEE